MVLKAMIISYNSLQSCLLYFNKLSLNSALLRSVLSLVNTLKSSLSSTRSALKALANLLDEWSERCYYLQPALLLLPSTPPFCLVTYGLSPEPDLSPAWPAGGRQREQGLEADGGQG